MPSPDVSRAFAAVLLAACGGATARPAPAPTVSKVETAEVIVPIPTGYTDSTAAMQAYMPAVGVALEGPTNAAGSAAVIVFQKASMPGGVIDEADCAARGKELAALVPDRPATLRATAVVTWARGNGCEYDYLTPDGVPTLLTEFHDPANTPDSSVEIWTVTCQHDDGDRAAIATCRATRDAFVVK